MAQLHDRDPRGGVHLNPRKKHNNKRAARHKAVKRSVKSNAQEWKGSDPEVRDAKRKIQKLFKSVRSENENGNRR